MVQHDVQVSLPIADYLVALANTNGGTFQLPMADIVTLERSLIPTLHAIRPALPRLSFIQQGGGIDIHVPRSNTVHALPDGRVMAWGNLGPIRLDGEQIRQLIAARAHDGFEQALIPNADRTVLDVLCHAHQPQKWLPYAVVQLNAYEGHHRYHQATISGTIYYQYHDGLDMLMDWLSSSGQYIAYPKLVIQELYLNALAHRDYRQKMPIAIHIYPSRIEMHIPGGLPGFATLSTLQHQHYHRNPELVGQLVGAGLMQGMGRGWRVISAQLAQEGYTHPQVTMPSPAQINISIERIATAPRSALNWRQDRALTHLRQHGSLTLRTLRVLCADQNLAHLQQDLAELVASGQLQAIGSGENAVYIQRV